MNIIEWDGKPITRPGIYKNVPISIYHGPLVDPKVGKTVSRSTLWKLFDKSPAHAWDVNCYNEARHESANDDTDPMRFGRAAHHITLSEKDFLSYFAIQPDTYPEGAEFPDPNGPPKKWNNNAYWCRDYNDYTTGEGRDILTRSQMEEVRGMAYGLWQNPLVRGGILNGFVEHTIVVRDPDSGLWLKTRPDCIPNDSGDFADFKTAADVSDEGLEESIGRDGLFMQAGMTAWACRLLPEPIELQSFNLVFSEKKRPYCARVRALTPDELDFGENCARVAAKMFAKCMERNVWPGPGGEQTDAHWIQMRAYHRKRLQTRLEIMESEF